MKKLLGCAFLGAFLLSGCAEIVDSKPAPSAQTAQEEVLNFQGENGLNIKLVSNDDFETAIMTSNKNNTTYNMVRKPSGSGVYMEDKSGANIHFKANFGVVEFEKYNSIPIELVD